VIENVTQLASVVLNRELDYFLSLQDAWFMNSFPERGWPKQRSCVTPVLFQRFLLEINQSMFLFCRHVLLVYGFDAIQDNFSILYFQLPFIVNILVTHHCSASKTLLINCVGFCAWFKLEKVPHKNWPRVYDLLLSIWHNVWMSWCQILWQCK